MFLRRRVPCQMVDGDSPSALIDWNKLSGIVNPQLMDYRILGDMCLQITGYLETRLSGINCSLPLDLHGPGLCAQSECVGKLFSYN